MLSHTLVFLKWAADLQEELPLHVFLLHTKHLRQHFEVEPKGRKVNAKSFEVSFLKQERMLQVAV